MARGLFHRAIAQSGCALNTWTLASGTAAVDCAKYLGCKDLKNEKEMLKILQNASKEDILTAQDNCKDGFVVDSLRIFGAVIEKQSPFEPSFLYDEPINIITSGNFNKVPIMMGYTSREGLLSEIIDKRNRPDPDIRDYNINFEKSVPHTIQLPKGSPMSKEIARRIKEFYYGNEEPGPKNLDNYYKLETDNFFLRGIYSSIKNHLKSSHSPIYFYRFSVEGKLNIYKNICEINDRGACHADDLGYLFNTFVTPQVDPGSLEDRTIKRMIKLWANFARTGNPNSTTRTSLIPVEWWPASENCLHFIDIGENVTIGCNPEDERMKFWDEIYSIYPITAKL